MRRCLGSPPTLRIGLSAVLVRQRFKCGDRCTASCSWALKFAQQPHELKEVPGQYFSTAVSIPTPLTYFLRVQPSSDVPMTLQFGVVQSAGKAGPGMNLEARHAFVVALAIGFEPSLLRLSAGSASPNGGSKPRWVGTTFLLERSGRAGPNCYDVVRRSHEQRKSSIKIARVRRYLRAFFLSPYATPLRSLGTRRRQRKSQHEETQVEGPDLAQRNPRSKRVSEDRPNNQVRRTDRGERFPESPSIGHAEIMGR